MAIEGFIVPAEEQVAVKKKTLVSSTWVLFNRNGERKFLDLDKYSILRRLRIHARDLRILDPLLSYPSTILGRERAIIVNLEVKVFNFDVFKVLGEVGGEILLWVVLILMSLVLGCVNFGIFYLWFVMFQHIRN